MSTVAIIPARGGSKGIKDKNITDLNGKPLIYYTLKTCFECKKIKYVLVTTDSKKIEKTVQKFFPKTIIVKRPKKISGDTSSSEAAILHAIKSFNYIFKRIRGKNAKFRVIFEIINNSNDGISRS